MARSREFECAGVAALAAGRLQLGHLRQVLLQQGRETFQLAGLKLLCLLQNFLDR